MLGKFKSKNLFLTKKNPELLIMFKQNYSYCGLRLSSALSKSVSEMEEIHTELSTAYTQGVVGGFPKQFLALICLK